MTDFITVDEPPKRRGSRPPWRVEFEGYVRNEAAPRWAIAPKHFADSSSASSLAAQLNRAGLEAVSRCAGADEVDAYGLELGRYYVYARVPVNGDEPDDQ